MGISLSDWQLTPEWVSRFFKKAQRRDGFARLCILTALVTFTTGQAALAGCSPDQTELRWPGGQARFSTEIADTEPLRAQGLMHREKMAQSAGMLFIYEQPRQASFWMKNTLIPLDMIFADETGRVTHVHANAKPHDLTAIDGGDRVQFVLEINGGLAARLGIKPGAEMRHPAISQPVWPCEPS